MEARTFVTNLTSELETAQNVSSLAQLDFTFFCKFKSQIFNMFFLRLLSVDDVLLLWTLKHKPLDIKKEVRLGFISGAGLLLFFHMILC